MATASSADNASALDVPSSMKRIQTDMRAKLAITFGTAVPKVVAAGLSFPMELKLARGLRGQQGYHVQARLRAVHVLFAENFQDAGEDALIKWTSMPPPSPVTRVPTSEDTDGDLRADVIDTPAAHPNAPDIPSRCLRLRGGVGDAKVDRNWVMGACKDFGSIQPTMVSFKVTTKQISHESGVVFFTDSLERVLAVVVLHNGVIAIEDELITHPQSLDRPIKAAEWYSVKLKFNWEDKKFSFLIDDNVVGNGIPFEDNQVSSLGKIYFANSNTRAETQWGDFEVCDESPACSPAVTPSVVVLQGGTWQGALTIDDPADTIVLQAVVDSCGDVGQSEPFDVGRFHRRAIGKANRSTMAIDLARLFDAGDLSDMTVVVGAQRFPVHKCILAARSPVLRSLLTSGMKDSACSELVVDDASAPAFARFLRYLYTSEGPGEDVPTETLLETYILADRYLLPGLKSVCEEMLMHVITVETVVTALRAADRFDAKELVEACLSFVVANFADVVQQGDYGHMEQHLMLQVQRRLVPFVTSPGKGMDGRTPRVRNSPGKGPLNSS